MVQNVALFQGVDADGNIGLWETNGTGSGTFELTPITGAAASGTPSSPSGLSPSNLVGFNGGALFEGKDLSGRFGLWVTTGTAAGTQEIAGTSGLSPNDLTVFGGQVLFSGGSGLWATNGTAAGTHEVTSVAGAPGDLTVFGSEVLFAGATGGLWETDGSSGGTHELAGTAGLNPFDLTVFGSEVLFASSTGGLWETNGAVGSTPTKIASVTPLDMVVYNGGVLFSGFDGAGVGLWETNGAAGSTPTEISGTSGLDPQAMIVYNGEVLFNGVDSSANGHGLWAWNGTSATELVSGIDPSNFAINNGVVLFSGLDSNGHAQLLKTNGQVGGTSEVAAGASGAALAPFDLTAVVTGFVSNPDLDIILQNTSGQLALWQTDGATSRPLYCSALTLDLAGLKRRPAPSSAATPQISCGRTPAARSRYGKCRMMRSCRPTRLLTQARIGTWSGLATSTTTAIPMCWSGTTTARSGSGT